MRPLHSICWIDLGVVDPARAARFYGGLFGWAVSDPDEHGYRVCLQDGRPVAGLGPSEEAGPPYWTVTMRVDDVAATARSISSAGGRVVVPPARAGEQGAYAVAVDASGAALSLWQPGTRTGMDGAGGRGTFGAADLLTDQPRVAEDFYRAVLGWTLEDGTFLHDGAVVAGLRRWGGRGSRWLVSFVVADVDHAVAHAVELGASPVAPGRFGPGHVQDPLGAVFGLVPRRRHPRHVDDDLRRRRRPGRDGR